MKRILITLLPVIMVWQIGHTQDDVRQKIEARKIAMISQKLDLTPAQAEKFWPIYREYDSRRSEIHRDFAERRRNFDPKAATDEETRKMLDLGMRVKERQLNLEREYGDRLRQVISDRQLLNLRRAEEDFRQMLLERVRERRAQMQRNRQNNEQLKNRRRNN